ncbi:GtrA family protein [Caballeronia jiangsuensis]|uniref:GtrA family protein n=1 Tax=Caballeronia jiangsuensis TaxID=1458357 RepID=UPI0038BB694A
MQREFLRFDFAGVVGFVVDAGVLYAALSLGCGPYLGRVISFLCAAFVTWQINRRITFARRATISPWREWWE